MIRVTQQDVWAASAYAWRMNGERYLSAADAWRDTDEAVGRRSNKDIVTEQLLSGLALVTDADRELGELARKAVTRNITYSMLAGHMVTEYDRKVGDMSQRSEWVIENLDPKAKDKQLWTAKYEWACLAAQIRRYFQIKEKAETAQKIESGYAAEVGKRVDTDVTVISANFSHRFLTYFVTALTESNQLVFFAYKCALDPKTTHHIRGTVKAHTHSQEYGTDSTQLSRVRIVKPKGE